MTLYWLSPVATEIVFSGSQDSCVRLWEHWEHWVLVLETRLSDWETVLCLMAIQLWIGFHFLRFTEQWVRDCWGQRIACDCVVFVDIVSHTNKSNSDCSPSNGLALLTVSDQCNIFLGINPSTEDWQTMANIFAVTSQMRSAWDWIGIALGSLGWHAIGLMAAMALAMSQFIDGRDGRDGTRCLHCHHCQSFVPNMPYLTKYAVTGTHWQSLSPQALQICRQSKNFSFLLAFWSQHLL